jgi:hypothetical protein
MSNDAALSYSRQPYTHKDKDERVLRWEDASSYNNTTGTSDVVSYWYGGAVALFLRNKAKRVVILVHSRAGLLGLHLLCQRNT